MEPNPLAQLITAVNQAIQAQNHAHALRLILSNFNKFKDNAPLREKVALIVADQGRKKDAVELYQAVGRHYANAGHPVRAISAARQMLSLMPDSTVLLDHIATLYNIRSPFIVADASPHTTAPPKSDLDLSGESPVGELTELMDAAVAKASEKKGLVSQPGSLPPISLLSLLPQETLRRVLDHIEYDVFDQTQYLLHNEVPVQDLLWAIGDGLVLRDNKSNMFVNGGAMIGLSGFGQAARAPKIDLFAKQGAEVLRLSRDSIKELSIEFVDFPNRIATLRRHAMTEQLLLSHPIFDGLNDQERILVMETFSGIRLQEGHSVIAQNTTSPGLFIILDGTVDVIRTDDDWEITIATLCAGEVFGEIGLVADTPAVAGCVMSEIGHVLHLPREDFIALAKKYPTVQAYTKMLAEERLNDVAISADDLSEVD